MMDRMRSAERPDEILTLSSAAVAPGVFGNVLLSTDPLG